jgi:hypothetical protein
MARTSAPDAGSETVPVEGEIDLGTEDIETEVDENLEVDANGNPVEIEVETEVDEDGNPIEAGTGHDDVTPQPRRGGGSETIRAQRRRAQEAEARTAALEREIAELRGFQQGAAARQVDPQAAARAEQEFYLSLETMAPAQAYQTLMQRGQQQVGTALQQLRYEQQELADQTRFDASCARLPIRESFRERVETYREQQRRAGFYIGREDAYYLLLGKEMEARGNRARPAQQRAAQNRVASQRTQPTGARGDAARGARRPQPGSIEHDEMLVQDAIRRGESVF